MAKYKIQVTQPDGSKKIEEVDGVKFKFEGFDFFYHTKPNVGGLFKVTHLQSGWCAARFDRSQLAACLKDKKMAAEQALTKRVEMFGLETFVKVMKEAPLLGEVK